MKIESRYGWVEIVEQALTWRFVVIGSSGYCAELSSCAFDLCADGTKTSCVTPLTIDRGHRHAVGGKSSIDAWHKHCETHCHGWHWPTVERFAREVLATYGARPAFVTGRPGIPRGSVYTRFVGVGRIHRDALAIANETPKEYRAELVKAFGTLVEPA